MDTFMILGACIAGASVVGYILFENKKIEKVEPLKLSYKELGDKENSFHFNYAFTKTKNSPDFLLKKVIGQAQEKLDLAVYTFTDHGILQSVLQATNRGVKVRLITDRHQSSNARGQDKILQQLKHAGVPVKINSHNGYMHLKMAIVDDSIVTAGSYNWTKAARDKHDEILVVMENKKLATEWTNHFNNMWNNTSNYEYMDESLLNIS